MAAEQNICANCGRTIGSLESPQQWQSHTVCPECYVRLSTAPEAAGRTNAPGYTTNTNYLLAALPHIGGLLGLGFVILPLVMMLIAADDFVRANAREALNFHITMFIYFLIAAILMLVVIGWVVAIALAIFMFVASIIATIKASQGQMYRYPLTIRMIG